MTDTEKKSVERKEVKIGMDGDGGMAEVISGLKEGEQIATVK